ncbi:multidrug effflux MFS transporter [Caenimonas sedimenti]|uniref:Multidrug effflux MFS transporter n=1 Tax=Caenimonas sedimenti TaxID=2596921 RepID=A0A562ZPD6_9BURK|nr:MFS transporter [Caenimonas sedimenti]TWO70452.1 multidrug effflux MFS transporter [Caenimonas sedimenti]
MTGQRMAALVVLAGISAALHVGKLPPAIPVLRDALGVSLLEAGFLLSMMQFAGMGLGLLVGVSADTLGLRRTMTGGLVLLGVASLLGAQASSAVALLALRACEGLGFLLATLPAPALIRRLVEGGALHLTVGWWGAYMPLGTAAALLAGPAAIAWTGWPGWWRLLAGISLAMALWLWLALPPSLDQAAAGRGDGVRDRLVRTLQARGPWLAALAFAFYSGQWLAVIGFLPTIYAQAGWHAGHAALATALAAGVNAFGNIASGRLLRRGWTATALLHAGYGAMALGAVLAFAPWTAEASTGVALSRYAGVLVFSAVGGLIPGTLFALAVRLAPDDATVSTTVGWMQQWSAVGQFCGPPAVAWFAARNGWDAAWWVTCAFAAAGALTASLLGRAMRQNPGHGSTAS